MSHDGAMDLSGLPEETPDHAEACSWMRVRITPGDPDESQILSRMADLAAAGAATTSRS